jgi:copper homeostasis protein
MRVHPLLEVIALSPGDVPGAVDGGADRLHVVARVGNTALTPAVETVRDIRRSCELPLRVTLRASEGYTVTGSELVQLKVAAHQLAAAGANGFVLGFLGLNTEVDLEATLAVVDEVSTYTWTFHHAIDHTLDHDAAWELIRGLPQLDAVLTAGSPRGLDAGLDTLCTRSSSSPATARLVMAGGALKPDHVPWLARAGIRMFHVGSVVRPGRSWKAYIDAGLVRSWRRLIDDVVAVR